MKKIFVVLMFIFVLPLNCPKIAIAQRVACNGAACSDVTLSRPKISIRHSTQLTVNGLAATNDTVATPKLGHLPPIQFGNHGTKNISISVSTATSLTAGGQVGCSNSNSFELAPGETHNVMGLICYPYQVNYAGQ